jgi:IclR family acetate operon transcriptional repressor
MANSVRNTESSRRDATHAVPAVATACRILDVLSRGAQDARTLTELAGELGLAKSTLHNQLTTLRAHGLVHRDEKTRRYGLGATLISLGLAAGRQMRSTTLVSQRLPVLAHEHSATFAVAQVADPLEAVLVDCAYPPEDVHVGLSLGSRYGPFDGAVGKCLLAAMEPSAADRFVRDSGIPRHTAQTVVDPDVFLAALTEVRDRGWSASAGEFKENHAVAAPLFGNGGKPELIIFCVGFPAQLPVDRFPEAGHVLEQTARAVERAIGVTNNDKERRA